MPTATLSEAPAAHHTGSGLYPVCPQGRALQPPHNQDCLISFQITVSNKGCEPSGRAVEPLPLLRNNGVRNLNRHRCRYFYELGFSTITADTQHDRIFTILKVTRFTGSAIETRDPRQTCYRSYCWARRLPRPRQQHLPDPHQHVLHFGGFVRPNCTIEDPVNGYRMDFYDTFQFLPPTVFPVLKNIWGTELVVYRGSIDHPPHAP